MKKVQCLNQNSCSYKEEKIGKIGMSPKKAFEFLIKKLKMENYLILLLILAEIPIIKLF